MRPRAPAYKHPKQLGRKSINLYLKAVPMSVR